MKRMCMVSFGSINSVPYAKTYINEFAKNDIECDIVFWDRDGNEKAYNSGICHYLPYSKKATSDMNRIHRYLSYFGATFFIRKMLSENKYDGIVFLQTHAAVACADILKSNYRGKYIVDIRDYTLEKLSLYFHIEQTVISNAFATIISSPAYKDFLPHGDFVMAHNYTSIEDKIREKIISREHDFEPIKISYVGTVRFFDMDKKILDKFANDKRFHLNYFGVGSDLLKDYCSEKGIENASFVGRFKQEDTFGFYLDTDVINNLYGNHCVYLDYALSNKLYHAAQLEIPILVCPNTYMEDIVKKYSLGFVLDINGYNVVDKLYSSYSEFDRKAMKVGCKQLLKNVEIDNSGFEAVLCEFVRSL